MERESLSSLSGTISNFNHDSCLVLFDCFSLFYDLFNVLLFIDVSVSLKADNKYPFSNKKT